MVPIKVILVGMGKIAKSWIEAVLSSPEVTFAGFVEVDDKVAHEKARLFGLDTDLIFPSLAEAIACVQADGVINLTPPAVHKEISFVAMEASLPVLSEKPLADTLLTAEAITEKARETGVLHMVAQNYRYKTPSQTVKQVLASGELGRVGGVTVAFFKGPLLTGFHQTLQYPLLVDMAIHHFDLLRFFLDAEPEAVFGRSWNPPWSWFNGDASTVVIMDFPGGVVATYDASWCSTGLETSWIGNWRFECEKGVLLLRDDIVYVQKRTERVSDEGGFIHYAYSALEEVKPVAVPYGDKRFLLQEFHAAVTQGKPPATTCQDNLKSLRMVFDTIKSIETGESVKKRA